MITGEDFYEVLSAMVPLYATMSLAYASVRFFTVFSPEQCAGINRFVAVFAIPFLSFKLIAFNNPYAINKKLIIADTLQKILTVLFLFLYKNLARRKTLDWTITLNSLITLPNTVVMGIPLLRAMYGDYSAELMVQIVVFQGLIWNTLLLIMCEFRAAKIFINDNFPGPHGGSNIVSLDVDSDVVSLADGESLRAEVAETDADGRLRVKVRRRSFSELGYNTSVGTDGVTPRLSNLTGVEIYSTRSSNFSQPDYGLGSVPSIGHFSLKESYTNSKRLRSSRSSGNSISSSPVVFEQNYNNNNNDHDQIHMFVWNSSVMNSPVSVSHKSQALRNESSRKGVSLDLDHHDIVSEDIKRKDQSASIHENGSKDDDGESNKKMPRASVVICLILTMVWRKLIRNPNTYSGLLGLAWSLISFRLNIKMPIIIKGSITILSDTGLGLSMFSLGLFMALQPKIIACGKWMAVLAMAIRFLVGPAVMAATSAAIGIRGVLLQVAILQAALPQAIVSFVFAKEYNVHPQILSTSVTIGMVVALPVTVIYYILLGL